MTTDAGLRGIQGKRVVVTGGAGVIGRELLALLAAHGAEVLSVDRLSLPEGDWSSVRHVRLDLAEDDLSPLVEFDPHVFMHLAAAFERSKESPEFWPVNWHDNVLNSHRMVDVARVMPSLGVFVFASSYLVYRPALYLTQSPPDAPVVLSEDMPKETRNVTGAAKLYTEAELDFLGEYFMPQLRVADARIFRVYGRGSKDVVSRWVRSALRGEPVELYNAANLFDYVYAADVAEGLARMAVASDARGPVNLSRGLARPVSDVVAAIDSQVPGFATLVADRGSVEEFEASQADVSRLERLLGWRPQTDIEQGIAAIVEHERRMSSEER